MSFSMASPARPYPMVNEHNGAGPEGHQHQYNDQVQYRVLADVHEKVHSEIVVTARRSEQLRLIKEGIAPSARFPLHRGGCSRGSPGANRYSQNDASRAIDPPSASVSPRLP